MEFYIMGFLASLIISYFTVPALRKFSFQVGALDQPGKRKINKKPIPNLGGIGIFLGFSITVLVLLPLDSISSGILMGGAIILLLGIIDDFFELSPGVKLLGQIVAAAILIVYGIQIEFITNPLGGMFYLGNWGIPLTILWVVALTNTLNLIDGLDGLAGGITVIAVMTLFFVSLQEGQTLTAVLAIALAGSSLGFLRYNFPPAKIFMGDSGSMFCGYILAAISVAGALKSAAAVTFFVPLLALGVPIFDTIFAIIRRVYNNRPIGKADKGHIHHRLLALGWTQLEAVLIVYGISFFLGIMALIINGTNLQAGLLILVTVLALLLYVGWKVGIFDLGLVSSEKSSQKSSLEKSNI